VFQPLGIIEQAGRLPAGQVRATYLLSLVAKDVQLSLAGADAGLQLVELAPRSCGAAHFSAHALTQLGRVRTAVSIEQPALVGRRGEPVMFVLPRDLNQLRGYLGEQRDGYEAPIDPGFPAPVGGDRTGHDHLDLFLVDLDQSGRHECCDRRMGRGQHEAALDEGFGGLFSHEGPVGAAAEEQTQRSDEQRLSRAGLPGQSAAAAGQRDLGPVDDPQGLHAELSKHVG
jgi:hypothetical protein